MTCTSTRSRCVRRWSCGPPTSTGSSPAPSRRWSRCGPADVDESDDESDPLLELVKVIKEIKPDISDDSLYTCVARLRLPERSGDAPPRDELERLIGILETKITAASWAAVALAAVEAGYYLPIS